MQGCLPKCINAWCVSVYSLVSVAIVKDHTLAKNDQLQIYVISANCFMVFLVDWDMNSIKWAVSLFESLD
jgi:hypothetical protein